MQDPTEPDRQEILVGPGDNRPSRKRSKNSRTLVIAASVLVAVIAAGGAGYMLAGNQGEAARQGGPVPAQSTEAGQEQAGEDDLGGEDTTTGDVTAESPEDDLSAGAPDDGSMGDVADPGPGDSAATGGDPSGGTTQAGNDKKPTTRPTSPQSSGNGTPADADNPADGPAGAVNGQCAKGGC